jgi:hypothetical protein
MYKKKKCNQDGDFPSVKIIWVRKTTNFARVTNLPIFQVLLKNFYFAVLNSMVQAFLCQILNFGKPLKCLISEMVKII